MIQIPVQTRKKNHLSLEHFVKKSNILVRYMYQEQNYKIKIVLKDSERIINITLRIHVKCTQKGYVPSSLLHLGVASGKVGLIARVNSAVQSSPRARYDITIL